VADINCTLLQDSSGRGVPVITGLPLILRPGLPFAACGRLGVPFIEKTRKIPFPSERLKRRQEDVAEIQPGSSPDLDSNLSPHSFPFSTDMKGGLHGVFQIL
jgi:hypothetical protein